MNDAVFVSVVQVIYQSLDLCLFYECRTYCPEPALSAAVVCPVGTFSLSVGANTSTTCQACPAGSYCSSVVTLPVVCAPGSFSLASSTTCLSCAPGTFSSSASSTCDACQPGWVYPVGVLPLWIPVAAPPSSNSSADAATATAAAAATASMVLTYFSVAGHFYRRCSTCAASFATIYYRRLTPMTCFDPYVSMFGTWGSACNFLNVDFALYSSAEDLQADTGRWSTCTYDVPGVAFPGGCAPAFLNSSLLPSTSASSAVEFFVRLNMQVGLGVGAPCPAGACEVGAKRKKGWWCFRCSCRVFMIC
jgi:hypothetical protein